MNYIPLIEAGLAIVLFFISVLEKDSNKQRNTLLSTIFLMLTAIYMK